MHFNRLEHKVLWDADFLEHQGGPSNLEHADDNTFKWRFVCLSLTLSKMCLYCLLPLWANNLVNPLLFLWDQDSGHSVYSKCGHIFWCFTSWRLRIWSYLLLSPTSQTGDSENIVHLLLCHWTDWGLRTRVSLERVLSSLSDEEEIAIWQFSITVLWLTVGIRGGAYSPCFLPVVLICIIEGAQLKFHLCIIHFPNY